MTRKQRQRRIARATAHRVQQQDRKALALAEATAAARKAKKGAAGLAAQMESRGYLPDGRGGWRRTAWPTEERA